MKKKITSFAILVLLLYNAGAQNRSSFYPFQGFHVGLTGQAEFIQKCSFIYLTGTDPAPRARWTRGWETGIEFSYHFGKYFGITAGFNYGTMLSYDYDVYESHFPDNNGDLIEVNAYERMYERHQIEMILPVKLEFHYPLCKDLFFIAEAGIKIRGIDGRLIYNKFGVEIATWSSDYYLPVTPDDYVPEEDSYYPRLYYEDWGMQYTAKINCNMLLGLGLYYKLPYGDLLRFTAGVNISFNNMIEGYYRYYLTESVGAFSVKNDFIYTQLSYIHTFNFQKAKKYVVVPHE